MTVDAISASSPTEAIVRATIIGATTNLRFRRFDTGWTWEFVETKSGGWVAPEVAIGQIREEHRLSEAKAFADLNRDSYAATAKTMYYISLYHVLNPTERENLNLVMRLKRSMVDSFRSRPDMQDRLPVLESDRWNDAWGGAIALKVSPDDDSTLIVSPGRDKVPGTDDDLVCQNTFRRGYENGRPVWEHDRSGLSRRALGASLSHSSTKGRTSWSSVKSQSFDAAPGLCKASSLAFATDVAPQNADLGLVLAATRAVATTGSPRPR